MVMPSAVGAARGRFYLTTGTYRVHRTELFRPATLIGVFWLLGSEAGQVAQFSRRRFYRFELGTVAAAGSDTQRALRLSGLYLFISVISIWILLSVIFHYSFVSSLVS